MALANLVVNLEANIASFTRDMQKASQQTNDAMNRIQKAADFANNALKLVGVGFTIDLLVGHVNRSIDALANLDDMAQKTGSSVENLSKLGKVAAMTSTDFGAVDAALVKLSKSMADVDGNGGKVRKAMESIGLSVDDIKNKDPGQVFVEITRRLQGYEDGATKVAVLNDLMGKSAADLIPYMNDVAEQFDNFNGESTEAAAAAAKLQDEMGRLRVKVDEMTTSLVTAAIPAANDFLGAIKDLSRESDTMTDSDDLTTWADDVALVFARMGDGAMLVVRTFKAIGAEIKIQAANVEMMDAIKRNVNPVGAAKVLLQGGSPTANIQAAVDTRNRIVNNANAEMAELWTKPLDGMERALLSRIAGRTNLDTTSIDALAGLAAPQKETLNYTGTTPNKGKSGAAAEASETMRLVSSLSEEKIIRDVLADTMREEQALSRDFAAAQSDEIERAARAIQQNEANVEQIRMSMLSEVDREAEVHQLRMDELQTFHDAKLENVQQANALMEQEVARHEQAKADMQRMYEIQSVVMAGDTASALYGVLEKAGKEKTALGKTLFVASKALAIAEIIMNAHVAAEKAKGQLGIFGIPLSAIMLAQGYASAGMVAGMAIASAEGGYDIPAGTNPVTQLHEKEMVLPKAQADVIRGLASRGGGFGGDIHYSPTIQIDSRSDQAQVQMLVSSAVRQGNAELVDKLSRAGRI